MKREFLPVWQQKETIIKAVMENKVIIVEAPTGSGKTTQLPQILYNAKDLFSSSGRQGKLFRIGVTQPRRLAAISVCKWVAHEMNVQPGGLVGYKIRFDDLTGDTTAIKIMTDGILLQEMRGDPLLDRYDVIIVDEAHERSLNIDFILGLLKKILEQRADFRVIISSATINAKSFSDYFNQCPILSIKADTYPVDIIYRPVQGMDEEEHIKKAVGIVDEIIAGSAAGDILIFFPGEASIKQCVTLLAEKGRHDLQLLPVYSQLSAEDQEKVFLEFPGKRKIIVATNIAETSITIDGVVYVIDPGLCKINSFNPSTFTSSLVLSKISKASCKQRTGRAGRTQKGTCYRLFSQEDYKTRDEFTSEEILRTDLTEVILRMADLGITEYEKFDFITPPGIPSIRSSVNTLQVLEALDEDGRITELGKYMATFPLTPRIARILAEAMRNYKDVVYEVLILASFLSTKNPYLFTMGEENKCRKMQAKLAHASGDFMTWIDLFNTYKNHNNKEEFCKTYYFDQKVLDEILNIHTQLQAIVQELGGQVGRGGTYRDLMLAVLKGFFQNICVKRGSSWYATLTEQYIYIHPGSSLNRKNVPFLVAGEIVRTGRTFARSGAMIEKEWIRTAAHDTFQKLFRGRLSRGRGRSRGRRRFGRGYER